VNIILSDQSCTLKELTKMTEFVGSESKKTCRKSYHKPAVERVRLIPKQTVLVSGCKTGSGAFGFGQNDGCVGAAVPCSDINNLGS
jgi:hypothetical protein